MSTRTGHGSRAYRPCLPGYQPSAVGLGLACCLLVGVPAWGSAYGAAFGAGRAFMLVLDARWSQGKPPVAVGFRIVAREADPQSRFWSFGVVSGLAVLCLALASVVP